MSQTIIYVVTGICGEYSDSSEWLVCWRMTEKEAQAVADACTEDAARIERDEARYWDDTSRAKLTDPFYQGSYTGTRYVVQSVSDDPHQHYALLASKRLKP